MTDGRKTPEKDAKRLCARPPSRCTDSSSHCWPNWHFSRERGSSHSSSPSPNSCNVLHDDDGTTKPLKEVLRPARRVKTGHLSRFVCWLQRFSVTALLSPEVSDIYILFTIDA